MHFVSKRYCYRLDKIFPLPKDKTDFRQYTNIGKTNEHKKNKCIQEIKIKIDLKKKTETILYERRDVQIVCFCFFRRVERKKKTVKSPDTDRTLVPISSLQRF